MMGPVKLDGWGRVVCGGKMVAGICVTRQTV